MAGMRQPRPVEPLDRLLVAGGADLPLGVLACFDPVLPPQASCDPATWTALRVRRDERWREHQGPIGDALRAMAAQGLVSLGPDGVVRHPSTGEPLTSLPGPMSALGADGEGGGEART
jgi:hypothetical protein